MVEEKCEVGEVKMKTNKLHFILNIDFTEKILAEGEFV